MDKLLHIHHDFYKSKHGRIVRRILKSHIIDIWPDCKNLTILGTGYALPYLDIFTNQNSARAITLTYTKDTDGAEIKHTALAERNRLPLPASTFDRALMIHDFEFCYDIPAYLNELERILSHNGRLLLVVPSRKSSWTHTDWSPFGYGAPFTYKYITHYLTQNGFTITYARRALFCPPYRNTTFFLKTAGLFEYFGRRLLPFLNGVYIIEAVKKTYAGTPVKDKPSLTPPLWSPFGKLVAPVSNRTQNSRTSNP